MFKRIKNTWEELNKPIFIGNRLKSNLIANVGVGSVCAIAGLVTMILNIIQNRGFVTITSLMFLIGGSVSAVSAGVFKNRRVAVITSTVLSAFVFTYYAVSGATDGFSVFWSLAMPIAISYFISVKYALILSIYYELLVITLFYTPLRGIMISKYHETTMTRFPLLFACVAALTLIAMIQYHMSARREIEYSGRLSVEVKKQTAVARERADKLELLSTEVVNTLAVAIDAKDRYTNGHSLRVASYSAALGKRLGMDDDEIHNLRQEAMLHDIGKIGIPDEVLNNPGTLTAEEFAIIKSHTIIGGKILSRNSALLNAADVARFHHERYDGTGYPLGLKGKKIPLHARIVTVADAYDAMRSDRVYRKGLSPEAIRNEFKNGKGTQFDPEFTEVFMKMEAQGELDRITAEANQQLSDAVDLELFDEYVDWNTRNK
jgi:HD-GYP domain-containing protein (c-di-GMP phosphodiesterase class II)